MPKHSVLKFLTFKSLTLLLLVISLFLILPTNSLAAPSCTVNPATTTPGGTVTITGTGLPINQNLTGTISNGALVNFNVTTDGSGSFSTTQTLNLPGTNKITIDLGLSGILTCGNVTIPASPAPATGGNPCTGDPPVCDTGLGSISSNPTSFTERLISIATGIAGGIALIIMVIGSMKILMASGDQQKIANGRDMLIAAVAGLLFLIFSVLILRFIGKDLLGLGAPF